MAKWLDKLKNYFADNPIVNWFKKFTSSGLTTTETQQNLFNSNEAALQRDWSSQEAERARDWNEEMYEKYNSLSGKIAQAEQAGVNPLFAVTGNSVTPMSTASSAPSGASASSGGFAPEAFTNLIGQLLGIYKAKSEVANIEADTELKRASAKREEADATHKGWLSKLSEREYNIITEYNFDVQEIQSRIHLNEDQAIQAFSLAGKYVEEASKISAEKDFLVRTASDREKIVEYDKLIHEFESSMSTALDSLSEDQKLSLKEWVALIFKSILALK